MQGSLTSPEWVEAVDRHYLAEYVAAGGSSVKFAACFPGVDHKEVATALRTRAERQGYVAVEVDSATTKIHMIDQLFGRIADQIPWNEIVERVLARYAKHNQWDLPESFSSEGMVEQLARCNQLSTQSVSLELQRQIDTGPLIDRRMAKDFRVAMYWLAKARLAAGTESEMKRKHIFDWLGGRIRAISELRPYQIFTKVNRANARHLLGSLLFWIRQAGYSGLVATVDGSRMFANARSEDGSVNYTKASRIDAYEVFREFIDSTDEFEGLLLTVFVPPEFIDIDNYGRGLGSYPALLFRVYDDVRDRNLANPLTALTRVNDSLEVSA
ncbi:MAG: BREX system ATP-binding domain-containing protein [Pirellulaceae bacterium]